MKPLNSMAAEEVERIYGRSTIKLLGPDGKTTASWEPVAAVLDWSARPEFWDDQDFILVDYPPLKRLLLEASIREQVRSLAGVETSAVGKSLQALAAQPELAEADLRAAAHQAGEASTTGKTLDALAAKIDGDHKWLSPRVLEKTQLQYEGRTLTFPRWAGEILDKKERTRSGGTGAAPQLTLIEEKATEVAERFFRYQALREHKSPATKPLDLLVISRPSTGAYGKYSTESFEKGMKPDQTLSPLETNVANTLVEFLQSLPSKEWALPGEDGMFDQKFGLWLGDRSPWLPLGVVIQSDESELSRAGLPLKQVVAFRKSYRDLEDAERAEPGNIPEAAVVAVITAARELGASLGRYGDSAAMARESRLNRFAPFSKAPVAYAFGLALLLLSSLGTKADRRTAAGRRSAALYGLGMVGLMAGIALQLYGFLFRFRIARWGPVTTMYETVVWAALATAALGLAIELLWRKKYAALAASGVALLATLLAENASCLDPSIQAIPLVLRSNRWLVGHVLPIVSSYAAFALAMGFGLLAVGGCLTATYRRSPSYRELAWPLWLGIPLYVLGRLGLDPSYRLSPLSMLDARWLDYASSGLAAVGGVLTLVGGFSLLGELANRSPRRACVLGVVLAAVGSAGVVAVATGTVQGPLASALASSDAWLVGLVGGVLIVMSLLAVPTREPVERIETLAGFSHRAMQVGVLLLAAGAFLGAAWARKIWGGYWRWEPKEVWVLVTFLVYFAPLLGRFTGRMSTFGLAASSVVCFMSVLMSWYGVNFALRVGMHNFGFTEGGGERIVSTCAIALLAVVGAAAWRRSRSQS
ncbi:MAG: cytochrome c biogenesis protein CcsA [Paludisphaera borealis]|uniref:cytochrome c biogenesis protein CcsA n=1 Tax=Paludisphaera borealis TaxID=1387353 RepID=UPI002844E4FC|nr:cytochrome c biogenesis protein CcsA [Paludisphaera borealis]MDR3622718.1 cytochrome c biogenesis protein CcsA [Paludisphaera borealis]